MVEKCCFLFSRVSHRDPKVEPAGLGSGAKVQSPATLLWGLTPATTAHQTLLRGLTPEPHFSENKSILFPSNSVNKGRYMSQYTNCALCIWSFIIFKIV